MNRRVTDVVLGVFVAPGTLYMRRRKAQFAKIQKDFPWIWAIRQAWHYTGQHFDNCEISISAKIDDLVAEVLNRIPRAGERLFIHHETTMTNCLIEILPEPEETWRTALVKRWGNPKAPVLAFALMGECSKLDQRLRIEDGPSNLNQRLRIYVPRPEKLFPEWLFKGGGNSVSAE